MLCRLSQGIGRTQAALTSSAQMSTAERYSLLPDDEASIDNEIKSSLDDEDEFTGMGIAYSHCT